MQNKFFWLFLCALLVGLMVPLAAAQTNSPIFVPLTLRGEPPPTDQPTATIRPTTTPRPTATTLPQPTAAPTATIRPTIAPGPDPTATPLPVGTSPVIETFEGVVEQWATQRQSSGTGQISRASGPTGSGRAALLQTAASGSRATIGVPAGTFRDAAFDHQWEERPGTFHWQRARVFVPAETVAHLGNGEWFKLAKISPSTAGSFGWSLQVRQNGALWAEGYTLNGDLHAFPLYRTLPTNRWFDLEIGLHSQAGPGTKRAFAVVVDGVFSGWFRQGNMREEIYDQASFGIVDTNTNATLTVYVDDWRKMTEEAFPDGPDTRPEDTLQTQDYRTLDGTQLQYDWATWQYQPTLHPQWGMCTPSVRLQAGRNIDRMPTLLSGWAEMEVALRSDVSLPPQDKLRDGFAGLIGFRKEINREENLEVGLFSLPKPGSTSYSSYLLFEAWTGAGREIARWELPAAGGLPGRNVPETGDRVRVRWEQRGNVLDVRASFYDASAGIWHRDVIDVRGYAAREPDNDNPQITINYLDPYHTAASFTIDTPYYGVQRFTVGTLETYPE